MIVSKIVTIEVHHAQFKHGEQSAEEDMYRSEMAAAIEDIEADLADWAAAQRTPEWIRPPLATTVKVD